MKKHLFPLCIALIAAMAFTSCKEETVGNPGKLIPKDSNELTQSFAAESASSTFYFTSDSRWDAAVILNETTEADWLTIDKISGEKGEASIKFTLLANTGDERTGKIEITCGEKASLVVNITQTKNVPVVEKDFSKYDEKQQILSFHHAEGISHSFKFTSKSAWTSTKSEGSEWLILNKSTLVKNGSHDKKRDTTIYTPINSGEKGANEIHFEVTRNEGTTPKTAKVTLISGTTELVIDITQEVNPSALLTFTNYDEEKLIQTTSFDAQALEVFEFNSKAEWTATPMADWITVDNAKGDAGDAKIIISINKNGSTERKGTLVLKSRGDELVFQITQFKLDGFGAYLLEKFDLDQDGAISDDEAKLVTEIECAGKGFKNLNGIERFSSITKLDCSNNELTELPLKDLPFLNTLICFGNKITKLNVSNNNRVSDFDAAPMETLTHLYVAKGMRGGQYIPGVCGSFMGQPNPIDYNRIPETTEIKEVDPLDPEFQY